MGMPATYAVSEQIARTDSSGHLVQMHRFHFVMRRGVVSRVRSQHDEPKDGQSVEGRHAWQAEVQAVRLKCRRLAEVLKY